MTYKKSTASGLIKVIVGLVCAVTVVLFSSLAVSAEGTLIISGFAGKDSMAWKAGDNVSGVALTQFSWEQDSHTYKRSCLEAVGKYCASDVLRTVSTRFDEPLNLAEYLNMAFDIYAPLLAADPDAIYFARLTLTSSDGDSTEHLQIIEGGKWNHVEAYIGSWDGRKMIAEAEIALAVDTSLAYLPQSSFYIDDISVSEPLDREMTQRYLFSAYTSKGASAILADDKSKISIVSDTYEDVSLEAEVFTPDMGYDVNCLRIRLANYSESDTLTLYYSTSDSQVTAEDKSVTIDIEPNSDVCDYYAYVGDAAQLRSINLTFSAAKGRIEIVSINAISAYEPYTYDTYGTLNACRISPDLSTITFSGEVQSEAALEYQNGYIAIFAHTSDSLPSTQELAAMTPLVKSHMTTRFELSCKLSKNGLPNIDTRFIAALVNESGEYKLISAPFYAENPEAAAKKLFAFNPDTKGFCADDISLIGELDAGITVLELDTRKLFVSKSESDPYIYRGKAYYFDGEYLDALSSKIKVLNMAHVQVLLRVYNWQDSYAEELTLLYAEDDYVNHTKAGSYPDGDDFVLAIGAYIAEKWVSDGKVIGVLWGEDENMTEDLTLTELVGQTAKNLRTIYTALVGVNPNAKLYVSLTDLYSTAVQMGDGELGLAEYLPALIKETLRYGQFPWEIAIESVYRVGQKSEREFISVNTYEDIRNVLAENNVSDKHMIFVDHRYASFMSRKSDSITDYVVGSYKSLFSDDIDAYIAVTDARADEIADVVRYIFTDQAYAIENTVKAMLDVDDLSQIVEGFDQSKLPSYRISTNVASTEAPSDTKGTFNYYHFDGVYSIGGLAPSYYSGDIRIANDSGSALSVKLDSKLWGNLESAAWLGVRHNFDIPEDLRLTPTLAFELKVDDTIPQSLASVAVKVVLGGTNERFESTAMVPVREWTTIYVDTSDFSTAKDTTSLQVLVGDSQMTQGTLKIRRIDGLSREYNDQSLSKVIEQTRLKRIDPDTAVDYSAYLPIAFGILVVLATVVAVVILTRRKDADGEGK